VNDFSWWSGLTVADGKKGVEMAGLKHETIDSKMYWYTELRSIPDFTQPLIHLLPNYDEYFIAYKDRSLMFDTTGYTRHVLLEKTFRNHVIFLNGIAIGGWRRVFQGKKVVVETILLVGLSASEEKALRAAFERFGAFLGMPVEIVLK
jgi:hypothetical protein